MENLTPHKAFLRYVGNIRVEEFLAPFNDDADKAIANLMEEQWWVECGGKHPDNLPELIRDYLSLFQLKDICDNAFPY